MLIILSPHKVKKMTAGIDCSNETFDLCIIDGNKKIFTSQFSNNKKGFKKMSPNLEEVSLVVIEATGPYYLALALYLYKSNVPVSVVNPLRIKRYSQMKMARAKTDTKDAFLIAQYGQSECPEIWEAPETIDIQIQQLDTYLKGLEKRKRMASNQLHALDKTGELCKGLKKDLQDEISYIEKKINKMTKQIDLLINQAYEKEVETLKSVPGLGPKSIYLILVCTNGFKKFENHKQVISYFGLAPRIFQSGTSVKGRSKICKMGMAKVRSTLYMAANSASKCNIACKLLYERMRRKGKGHKQSLIAVANKLIKQAFAIVKSGIKYDKTFAEKAIS